MCQVSGFVTGLLGVFFYRKSGFGVDPTQPSPVPTAPRVLDNVKQNIECFPPFFWSATGCYDMTFHVNPTGARHAHDFFRCVAISILL